MDGCSGWVADLRSVVRLCLLDRWRGVADLKSVVRLVHMDSCSETVLRESRWQLKES